MKALKFENQNQGARLGLTSRNILIKIQMFFLFIVFALTAKPEAWPENRQIVKAKHFSCWHPTSGENLRMPEIVGPSGVRALPLAAGINVGGHYKGHFLVRACCVRQRSKLRWPLFLVRAALCRRCLTAVGHYWSERVACASGAT